MGVRVVFALVGAVIGYFAVQYFMKGAEPPTQQEVAAAFAPVEGYTYQEVPAAQLQPMRDAIASDPELESGIAVFEARTIQLGTQPIGAMIIMGIDPDEFGGDYRQEFLDGFRAGSGGAEATSMQINGKEAFSGDALGSHFVAFFDEEDGMIFMVIGPNAGSVEQIATTVHAANI
jgi:hypothetical protein